MAQKKNGYAERAAAVVIALGAENASNVYKFLREDEIEQISLEIAKMERMPPEELRDIMEDFYGLCVT
ncbi:MAG: flagellar motor switch protein FliG, partial [Angelakisella sp.]